MKNFFVSHKNPITVVLAIIILGGLFAYSKLQTALFPEITFPKIKIIADAGQQMGQLLLAAIGGRAPAGLQVLQQPKLNFIDRA